MRTKGVIPHQISMYLILGTLSLLVRLVSAKDCSPAKYDQCSSQLEKLHKEIEYSTAPEKEDELDALCKEALDGVDCMKTFTKDCTSGDKRKAFNFMYGDFYQFVKDLCKKGGNFRKKYLKYAPCQKKAATRLSECTDNYEKKMAPMMTSLTASQQQDTKDVNKRVITICCAVNKLISCSKKSTKKDCGALDSKFTEQLIGDLSNSINRGYCEGFTRGHPELCGKVSGSKANRLFQQTLILRLVISILLIFLQNS